VPIPEYVRQIREKIGHELLFMPGVIAVIMNERGETLIHLRADTREWALVGGILEPGEEPAPATAREVREEVGLRVVPEQIVGVYAEDDGVVNYPNGDVMQFLTIVFRCRLVGGEARVNDDESLDVRWVRPEDVPPDFDARHRRYLMQALRGDPRTDFNRE
jgi:8-oxo-dGTP pyrophosphatase MutT (NUDIX family)